MKGTINRRLIMCIKDELTKVFNEVNECILNNDFEKLEIDKYTVLIKIKDYKAEIWISNNNCCLYKLYYKDFIVSFEHIGLKFKQPKKCLKIVTDLNDKEKSKEKTKIECEMDELKKKLETLKDTHLDNYIG